ncbi:MAG: hypothetical protein IJ659_04830 [Alloprevotella sp.]|nr:hypothetical protein [Alloprevotella sp.]
MKKHLFVLFVLICVYVAPLLAQPGGEGAAPPQFMPPTYIQKPVWMQYEEAANEPLEAVRERLARSGKQTFAVDTLLFSGEGAIGLVVMGDGYTAAEQEKFVKDASACIDYLFNTVPFDCYRSFFNVFALHVESQESGISHPGQWRQDGDTGRMACPENKPLPLVTKQTFFSTHLDGWGMHRLIGAWNEQAAKDLARLFFPQCKLICILCNTDEYGGAGGTVLIATCNASSREIFVHELSHVFGDLADEYFSGDIYMQEKPNLSATKDSARVRWARWIGEPEVGVFPHSGGRMGKYFVKPVQASDSSRYCKMERLGKDFCPVCRERLVEAIHEQAQLIVDVTPADSVLAPLSRREQLTFSLLRSRAGEGNTLEVRWLLDGRVVAENVATLTLSARELPPTSPHAVRLEVYEESPYVRNPACRRFHTQSRSWFVAAKR